MSDRITLASLAPIRCWVAWQVELRKGNDKKPTKLPYNPASGRYAQANAPSTWGSRPIAEQRAATLPKPFGIGGVGLSFCDLRDGRHISGIDLDTCRDPETGAIADWAEAIIDRFASYSEVSPSQTGVKVFFLHTTEDRETLRTALGLSVTGKLKHSALWARRAEGDHPPAIELHLSNRYFAVTDDILPGSTDELREVSTADVLHLIQVIAPAFLASGLRPPTDDPEADAAIAAQQRPLDGRRATVSGTDNSRSAIAFRVGAQARRGGATFEDMCDAIRDTPESADWYVEKGTANDGRELKRIWENADPFSGDLVLFSASPLNSARQFIGRQHTLGVSRTLHHQNASFYTWRTSHYEETAAEEMRARLYSFLDGATTIDENKRAVPFNPTKNKVANVLEATAAEAQLSRVIRAPTWLDGTSTLAPGEVIACKNLLLHLPTLEARQHTPAFFTLNALSFDYEPAAPKPKEWFAFLDSILPGDAEAIAALQEMFGLCLTAETKYQKAFLLVGPKRSGKGTIARVLTELLGAANVCGPTLSSLSQNFGLAPLIGKRVAIIADARLGGRGDQQVIVERLLSITGEDGLSVDRKFRDAWNGKLDVRFLILTNELPRLTDSSGALAGRFVILTLRHSFYGREDLGLQAKLSAELPGILLWAIEGWKRLTARGHFIPPASSAEARRAMEDLGSPIGAFLRDRCTVQQGQGVRCDELYRAWCDWCHDQGRDHAGTVQTFGRDLNAAIAGLRVEMPRGEDGKQVRYYSGLGLNVVSRADTGGGVTRDDTRVSALRALSEYHRDDPGYSPLM